MGKCELHYERERTGVKAPNILRSDNLKRCNLLDAEVRDLARILERMKMRVELMCCTETLLQEASDPDITQKSIALTYAMAIDSSETKDWPAINRAILERWPRGLERIKRMAWKRIEERERMRGQK